MARVLLVAFGLMFLSACASNNTGQLIDMDDPRVSVLGVSVIVSELAADRVVRDEPQDAGPTYARLEMLAAAMGQYIALEHSAWYNATRHDARRSLYLALRDIVGSRVDSLFGPNGSLALSLGFALNEIDRAGKASALREDIIALKTKMDGGALAEQEVTSILVARFERNLKRVAAIRGVM